MKPSKLAERIQKRVIPEATGTWLAEVSQQVIDAELAPLIGALVEYFSSRGTTMPMQELIDRLADVTPQEES